MKHSRRIALSRATFSGFLLSLLSLTPSKGAPTGAQVAHGSAGFQQSGNLTTIRASNGAVINYTGFNIGRGETVTFIQPSSSSRVLNRVNSPDPTNIFGQLNANGIVYLVNPNGIYFQNGSMLNVGHLYAAAGHLSDTDFLTGKNHFSSLTGDLQNSGSLMASGDIHLFGEHVANFGSIASKSGVVVMTAGADVLVGPRDSHIYVRANTQGTAPGAAPGVQNTGEIRAPRAIMGAGDMYAVAISNTGLVKSRQIALDGGKSGAVKVSGTLDASSTAPRATGGTITVTGQKVALQGATLNASGARGGGTVLVGGGFRGQGPLAPAQTTSVDAATSIKADATVAGAGGKVVVWSQQYTGDAGSISAQGAGAKGAGGSAEISSKGTLGFTGTVNLQGTHGRKGSLLLDPRTILISDVDPANTTLNVLPPTTQTVGYGDSPSASVISAANLDLALSNATVTLQAIDDITIHSDVTGLPGGNLVLQAGRSITFGDSQSVTISLNGSLSATAHDPSASSFGVSGGTPAIVMFSGSTINTGGSAINLTNSGGGLALTTLNAGSGSGAVVTLSSAGAVTASGGITASSLLLRGGGSVSYQLNNSGNSVGKLAADANGAVSFSDSIGLAVDTVSGISGVTNSSGAAITLASHGALTINQAISNGASGLVRLESNGNLTEAATGSITTGTLGVRNDSTSVGSIDLTQTNSFSTVAGRNLNTQGDLLLSNTGATTVGSVTAAPGFTATTGLLASGTGNIAVRSGGDLVLQQQVSATGGKAYLVASGNISETGAGALNASTAGVRNNSTTTGSIILGGTNAFSSVAAANQNATAGGSILLSSAVSGSVTVNHLTSFSGASGVLFADTIGISTAGNNNIDLTSSSSALSLVAQVNAGSGVVHLTAQTGLGQTSGLITAGTLGAQNLGATGSILLSGANQLGVTGLAGVVGALNSANGQVIITSTKGLTVGTVPLTASFPQVNGITAAGNVTLTAGANVQLDQNIAATGATVTLVAASGSVIETTGRVLASKLDVTALNAPAFATVGNTASTIAAHITGANQGFSYTLPTGTLTVGTITTSGVTVNGGAVNLSATAGDLVLASNVAAGTGGVTLNASGAVTETTGVVTAGTLGVTAGNSSVLTGGNAVGTISASLTGAGSSFYFANTGATATGAIGTLNGDVGIQCGGPLTLNGLINAGTGTVRLISIGDIKENTVSGGIVASALGVENLAAGSGSVIQLTSNNSLGSPITPGVFAASDASAGGSITLTNAPAAPGWTLQISTVAAPAVAVPGFNFTTVAGVNSTAGGGNLNNIQLTAVGTLDLVSNVAAPGANVLLSATQLVKESTGLIFSSGPTQTQGLAVVSAQTPVLLTGNAIAKLAVQVKNAGQTFAYTSANALTIDNVLGVHGVSTNVGAITLETSNGALTLADQVNSLGAGVQLLADSGAVTETGAGVVLAGQLAVRATTTSQLAGNNAVSLLAAQISSGGESFTFYNTTSLTIGATGALLGLANTVSGDLNVQAAGTLQLNEQVSAGTGNVRLSASGNILQGAGGLITAGRVALRNESSASGVIDLPLGNQFTTLAAQNSYAGGGITVVNVGSSTVSIGADPGLVLPGTSFQFVSTNGLSLAAKPGFSATIGVQTPTALTIDAAIVAMGLGDTVLLRSAGGITQAPGGGIITADTLGLRNDSTTGGSIVMGSPNNVSHLAAVNAYAGGDIAINAGGSGVTVGSVGRVTDNLFDFEAVNGLATTGNQDIGLASGGTLSVMQPIDAGSGTIRLLAHGNITQTASGLLNASALGARTDAGDIALFLGSQIATVSAAGSTSGAVALASTNPAGLTIGAVHSAASGNFTFDTVGLSGGSVLLVSNGGVSQMAGALIDTPLLGVRNESGVGSAILLTEANSITKLAAANLADGEITIVSIKDLTISSAPGRSIVPGVDFTATAGVTTTLNADIGLQSSGVLAVGDSSINAGSGTVRLEANGGVSESALGGITAGTLGVRNSAATGAVVLQGKNFVNTLAIDNSKSAGGVSYSSTSPTALQIGAVTAKTSGQFNFDSLAGVHSGGTSPGVGDVQLSNAGGFVVNADVAAQSATVPSQKANVIFSSTAGTVVQNPGTVLTGAGLGLQLYSAPMLQTSGNSFTKLAAHLSEAGEAFSYEQGSALTIGTIGSIVGVITNNGAVALTATAGDLTVDSAVNSGTGNGAVRLTATAGNLTLHSGVNSGTGDTLLSAQAGTVTEDPGVSVKAGGLAVQSLDKPMLSGNNAISRLAAEVGQGSDFSFTQANTFTVDTVMGIQGISGIDGLGTPGFTLGTVTLESGSGQLREHNAGIVTKQLNITANSGIALDGVNKVRNLMLSNSGGDVSFTNFIPLLVQSALNKSGNISIASSQNLSLGGSVNAGPGAVSLSSGGLLSQGAASQITAGLLSTTSTAGAVLTGKNHVTTFLGKDGYGGIDFANVGKLSVAGATESLGDIKIVSSDTLKTTGAIRAGGQISLSASGNDIDAAALLDGGSITLAGRNIELSDANARSGDLNLQATGELVLDGTSYSGQNVLLNTEQHRLSNGLVSILFTNPGDVTVQAKDNFTVGDQQGVIANGSLTIDASTASLSDTAARTALTVSAGQVILLDRQPNGRTFHGRHDEGLNFVAPTIDFGGASISFSGQGNGKANFSVASGLPNVQRIGGVSFFADATLSDQFQGDLNALTGNFAAPIALPIQPLFGGSVDAEVVAALAGALPEIGVPQGSPEPTLSAATLEKLNSIQVYARRPSPEETTGIKARRALFNQLMTKTMLRNPEDYKVVVNRIAPGQVEKVLGTYDRMFGPKQELKKGMEKLFSDEYAKYQEKNPDADASGFGEYLVKAQGRDPQARNSLAVIGQFRELFTLLGRIGLTPKEVSITEEGIVGSLKFDGGLQRDDFLMLIGTAHAQPAAPAPAAPAAPAPPPMPVPQADIEVPGLPRS